MRNGIVGNRELLGRYRQQPASEGVRRRAADDKRHSRRAACSGASREASAPPRALRPRGQGTLGPPWLRGWPRQLEIVVYGGTSGISEASAASPNGSRLSFTGRPNAATSSSTASTA